MKIGFYGATGSYDFGDYAMMVHNIQDIIRIKDNVEFYIITPNKYITLQNCIDNLQNIENIYKIKCVGEANINTNKLKKVMDWGTEKILKGKWSICKEYKEVCKKKYTNVNCELLECIQKIDIMIFNGGGYLQHSWKDNNYLFCDVIRLASHYGKPIYFLSNSIGPMKKYNNLIKDNIQYVDKLMIRDGHLYTEKLLKEYNYYNYINGPDDLMFTGESYDLPKIYDNYVVIEVMAWINNAKMGEKYILDNLLQFINYIIKTEKNIVLVTFDNSDMKAQEYMKYIYMNVTEQERVRVEWKIKDMYRLFGIYKYCDFSLSFKYHPAILALGNKKPFIAVITDNDGYYEGKLKGACDNCDISFENHVIYLDDIDDGQLINLYIKNLNNKDTIDNSIYNKLKNIRKEYLAEILNKNE